MTQHRPASAALRHAAEDAPHSADVVVLGHGLAGLAATCELLEAGRRVVLTGGASQLVGLPEVTRRVIERSVSTPAASAAPARSSVLDGMHAQYEHSPPSNSCSTSTAVRELPRMA